MALNDQESGGGSIGLLVLTLCFGGVNPQKMQQNNKIKKDALQNSKTGKESGNVIVSLM